MVSGTTLTIIPSLVVSLSTTTANDDGIRDYFQTFIFASTIHILTNDYYIYAPVDFVMTPYFSHVKILIRLIY